MAMSVGKAGPASEPEVMLDINTTPLIDVMLVLLIMLIITIPIQLHSVGLNLPTGTPPPPTTPPEIVRIEIDTQGQLSWNGEPVASRAVLEQRFSATATQAVQPELHVRPDRKVPYRFVAGVMAAAQRNGLTKVGLIGSEQFL